MLSVTEARSKSTGKTLLALGFSELALIAKPPPLRWNQRIVGAEVGIT